MLWQKYRLVMSNPIHVVDTASEFTAVKLRAQHSSSPSSSSITNDHRHRHNKQLQQQEQYSSMNMARTTACDHEGKK